MWVPQLNLEGKSVSWNSFACVSVIYLLCKRKRHLGGAEHTAAPLFCQLVGVRDRSVE